MGLIITTILIGLGIGLGGAALFGWLAFTENARLRKEIETTLREAEKNPPDDAVALKRLLIEKTGRLLHPADKDRLHRLIDLIGEGNANNKPAD